MHLLKAIVFRTLGKMFLAGHVQERRLVSELRILEVYG